MNGGVVGGGSKGGGGCGEKGGRKGCMCLTLECHLFHILQQHFYAPVHCNKITTTVPSTSCVVSLSLCQPVLFVI